MVHFIIKVGLFTLRRRVEKNFVKITILFRKGNTGVKNWKKRLFSFVGSFGVYNIQHFLIYLFLGNFPTKHFFFVLFLLICSINDAEVSSSDLAAARDKYSTGGHSESNFFNYYNF